MPQVIKVACPFCARSLAGHMGKSIPRKCPFCFRNLENFKNRLEDRYEKIKHYHQTRQTYPGMNHHLVRMDMSVNKKRDREILDIYEAGGVTTMDLAIRHGVTRSRINQILAKQRRLRVKASRDKV